MIIQVYLSLCLVIHLKKSWTYLYKKSETNYGTFKRESLNIGGNLNESNNKQYRKFHKSEIWRNRIKAKHPDLESDR